ncbi:alcohol dehydrogenase, zinc-binding protein [Minicystis rosea]|nr:alcohol dehydrogenase, zinc-binding protein [Minicystis rosea]
MRAVIYDPSQPRGLRSADVPPPSPTPSQVLIEVHAVSLNFGETAFLAEMRKPGEVPGVDAAGVVVRAAADGSGPKEGTRVTSFGWRGGWAELRAASTSDVAVVPSAVDLGAASALPAAGVTALRALRALGPIVGRRVLVTGASGGVGRFAVQLAHRAGAHVVAAVGSAARAEGLRALGADEVVSDLADVKEPVFGVLENVGGAQLARALGLVERGGSVQSIGMASREPSTIDFELERRRAGQRRIEVFAVGERFGADLAYLVSLLEREELDPQIGWRGGWERVAEAAEALLDRRVLGKAVLDLRREAR